MFSSELDDDLLGEDLLTGKKVRDVHRSKLLEILKCDVQLTHFSCLVWPFMYFMVISPKPDSYKYLRSALLAEHPELCFLLWSTSKCGTLKYNF